MIHITAVAVADLERLRSFLADRNPLAATAALAVIRSAIDQLEEFPRMGNSTNDPGIRQVFARFGKSGYLIRYVPDFTTKIITVTRIWHSREARK